MILPKRMVVMFDSITIEFHLIHYCLGKGYNSIGIFTIETVKSLPKSKFSELIPVEDYVFFSVNKWYFKNTKIDVLKKPNKNIYQKNR